MKNAAVNILQICHFHFHVTGFLEMKLLGQGVCAFFFVCFNRYCQTDPMKAVWSYTLTAVFDKNASPMPSTCVLSFIFAS